MIDFWADIPKQHINYEFRPKSIISQVVDVFNSIAEFAEQKWDMKVFPFMGLNTTYYSLDHSIEGEKLSRKSYEGSSLEKLLEKYFGEHIENGETYHEVTRQGLEDSFGSFKGNIEKLGRGAFAGIKFYPPTGFDPWPDEKHEKEKVKYLYNFCVTHNIPITTHCSDNGFIVDSPSDAHKRANPKKWERVLEHNQFQNLKLNFAHFGGANAGFQYAAKSGYYRFKNLHKRFATKGNFKWVQKIIQLIDRHENVYTDLSYGGVNEEYYQVVADIIKYQPVRVKEKLENRILFGTDFSVHLMSISTYRKYIEMFLNTECLTLDQKLKMCSLNPERFLFK